MTKEELEKIKEFAWDNFCADESEQIFADDAEVAVTNPWVDHSGRFELNDEQAVKEWGLPVVIDFILKAMERMKETERW